MKTTPTSQAVLKLEPHDHRLLVDLCGQFDEHIRQIEDRLGVTIRSRGNTFQLDGPPDAVAACEHVLNTLYAQAEKGVQLTPEIVHLHLQQAGIESGMAAAAAGGDAGPIADNVAPLSLVHTRKATIQPRGKNQQDYVEAIQRNDINFGVGPAGTGKTYLAVACAVQALQDERVRRILLVRPAVEAGEKLGFLPGDLAQKIDPYLRPLYDALYEMMGFQTVNKLIERNVIEIAPLAFMRGRSLNDSFIILDESQNTTREQMKMFLTRIGFGSTAVITGDATQVDLPRGAQSGLTHAVNILKAVDGISVTYFESKDVVRHPIVQRVVDAYDAHDSGAAPADRQ